MSSKFSGKGLWFVPGRAVDWTDIPEAIVLPGKVSFEFVFENHRYLAELHEVGENLFDGQWSTRGGASGKIGTTRLYRSNEEVMLRGRWIEATYDYDMVVELSPEDADDTP
jgi:hypothetical protein